MSRADIAVVVIGRNEGGRLVRSLRSASYWRTIYVDSASTDGSVERARAAGAETIGLDPGSGLSAARGRNAGLERVLTDPAVAYVQMLDGDTMLEPGWIASGIAAFEADPALGAVLGSLRELRPDASVYAWLCDVEWRRRPGPADSFAGNVLLRAEAIRATGRYADDMIAGEDIDFARRMAARGWNICVLPRPMAVHDSALLRFGQWWRRATRSGHAFAELHKRHRDTAPGAFARNRGRILFWGGAMPAAIVTGLALAASQSIAWLALSAGALLLIIAQLARSTLREARVHGLRGAFVYSLFLAIGKYAEMVGLLRHALGFRRPRPTGRIEAMAR